MSSDDEQDLPLGRFGRLARLAAAGARTGSTLLFSKDARKGAAKSAAILGQLRGAAAKVGQMVSYVDGLVPPEHRDAFESTMGTLRDAAPRSSTDEIRALVESQLGESVSDLFAEWNDEPLASASIGQVHRAKLHDGRDVAVKVQHPGIIEAMESDLKNAAIVEAIIGSMGMAKFDSKRLTEEVKDRFREELNYNLEADRQIAFAKIHAPDPLIRIPGIIETHCSSRVLTSDLMTGFNFNEARGASEELRKSWAETLWRFVYRANLVGGMFNADPHPGNYFFQEDGGVGFLDFGCVQPIPNERRLIAAGLHYGAATGDTELFNESAKRMLQTRGGAYEEMAIEYVTHCFKPIRESPFHITQEFAGGLVERFKKMAVTIMRTDNDNFVPMPPGILFMNRLQFGFYSVLARMDVTVDYRAQDAHYIESAIKTDS